MANVTAKTSSNIFYKARCEAATHNEQLSSREGAADYMSIDRGRLYRIESGIAVPYPEEIRLMADLYNAPELENYFCRTMCPLGCEMPKAELANLDRITVRTLSVFRKIGKRLDFKGSEQRWNTWLYAILQSDSRRLKGRAVCTRSKGVGE